MPDHDLKMKIDHIGIATEHLEDGLAIWRDALGLTVQETEEVAEQRVRVAMLPMAIRVSSFLNLQLLIQLLGSFWQNVAPAFII